MALVDEVTIHAAAGKGGNGVIRWLHTKIKERGGPAGGDGGRGGDVVLEGVRDLSALARYRYEKNFRAEEGQAGENDNRTGADGAPLILRVPVGTMARVLGTGEEVEVAEEGERVVIFKGGGGGKGNARFKGSTNQNPFAQTNGKDGEAGEIAFSLRLIAEVGLIGLPSAGKSSLLNALTRAQAKVGAYDFTTLEPNLGDFYGHILADIPGLIEGASEGRGLGSKFLKHIEKTGILLHLVSAEQEDPLSVYRVVAGELSSFGKGLSDKREIVVLSKIDLVEPAKCETLLKELSQGTGKETLTVSVQDPISLKAFSDQLTALLAKHS